MEYKYLVINKLNDVICAWCLDMKQAQEHKREFEEEDKYFQKVYGWSDLPEYIIKEA